MKNKILYIFLFSLLIVSISIIAILFDHKNKLNNEIELKDKMISDISYRDSIYAEKTKEYSEIITKYVSNCEFVYDNKTISTKELLKIVNDAFNENALLSDSLELNKQLLKYEKDKVSIYKLNFEKYRDSTFYYKFGFKVAQKDYGLNYEMKISDNTVTLKRNFTKLDSALILFPYYRDKLKKDSITGNWLITIEKHDNENKKNKRKK